MHGFSVYCQRWFDISVVSSGKKPLWSRSQVYRRYSNSLKMSMLEEPVDLFGFEVDSGHEHQD